MSVYPFALPYREVRGSVIRELFGYMSQPGMISFAGGYPGADLFDREGLAAACAGLAEGAVLAGSLQYGASEGRPRLRELMAQMCRARGVPAEAADVLVTTGSQQAFLLLVQSLVTPGDTVIVERPAYPAALQALRLAGAHIETVGVDADGMDTEALSATLERLGAARRPKLIYLVPDFANPTGISLSPARRLRLLELAVQHQVLLVEDDPYGELRFSGTPIPPLAALAAEIPGAADYVVYLSSLSKIIAPGLRIGWMKAPAEILRRAVMAKQVDDLCTSPLAQAVAENYLAAGSLQAHMPVLRAAYGERGQRLSARLHAALGGQFGFTAPAGGMFLWVNLPAGWDAAKLLQIALRENVMFVPGAPFFADTFVANSAANSLRLSYAMVNPEEIDTGVARLARAVALYS